MEHGGYVGIKTYNFVYCMTVFNLLQSCLPKEFFFFYFSKTFFSLLNDLYFN